MKLLFSVFLFSVLVPYRVWAAACCGGGVSMPALVVGDPQFKFSFGYTTSEIVIDNVDSQGIWRVQDSHQKIQTMKMDAVQSLSELWQMGLSIPVISRSFEGRQASGLGDVSTSLGYEYLEDLDSNPSLPRGIGFVQIQWPTGKSRADSEMGGLDSRGNGFFAVGLGTLLTKYWNLWDVYSQVEWHHSFEKTASGQVVQGVLRPGNGALLDIGAGYNWSRFRAGIGLSEHVEDPVTIESKNFYGHGVREEYASITGSLSFLQDRDWSWTLSYADQTLIGNPSNTSLGRSVTVQLQRHWIR